MRVSGLRSFETDLLMMGMLLILRAMPPFFSDLLAERAALLLLFSTLATNEVIQWVSAVLDAQLPDGTWGRHSTELPYDGKSVTVHTAPTHTSALALLIFLDMPGT